MKQNVHNEGQYLHHAHKGPTLRQFVEKAGERPQDTILRLRGLLKTRVSEVIGFVGLGGLAHFNGWLKKEIFSKDVLALLLQPAFPFLFEEIESSGLGQTVYDISEKKGPFQILAKKLFEVWREQNKAKKRKRVRNHKVRFIADASIAFHVPFEANQTVNIFSLAVAKQLRKHFRASTPWVTPQVLSQAAIVQLKINKKCISGAKEDEERRQRSVLEETSNRMTTPDENYTPGRTGEETKIVPNEVESQSPAVIIPSPKEPQKASQQLSEAENDFMARLFSSMESAGFPDPNSRKRRRPDSLQNHLSLPNKRRFHDNGGVENNGRRSNKNFRSSRSQSGKRRICRWFNSSRGCVYGDRCYDLHERRRF